MTASTETAEINMPSLPAKHDQFIPYIAANPKKPMVELLEPYKHYDTELRKVFAQQPDHPAAKQPNVIPIFDGHEDKVNIRARNLDKETEKEKECYIIPLKDEDRKQDGSAAIVQSLRDFKTHFTVFSESSLVDLDWSNVVAAGSAVVTSLLAVPEKHAGSKRALRQYYHEKIAPASDVDLFLYDLTEAQAIDKIKHIERAVRDALLVETTTIRTKNTITIASRHPVRHVQIVLRTYNSITEILTGFDVDCSCAAYDGDQVYASPRAIAAYMTQFNTVDLTRRSPSYENRLSKYARRGFEVYWPSLDRSRIDPTIFERSFARTEGLARLLILEKLPKNKDREAYADQRRDERGRPSVNRWRMRRRLIPGNIKNDYEDEIAEWDDEDVSNYHSVTIPYGPKFHARKILKLLYTKDMLLNAEWNKPKDREVNLHRHPTFFGTVDDVIHDCCGHCPKPSTIEEEKVAEEESKIYISGEVQFMKDDPGRQAIGSFNPLTADDWTTMAYVGNTALLCQAIVDDDLDYVQSWLEKEGNDPNVRDYTGRAPLHLAAANSTVEIVQALIDNGARMVARLVDGKTALHLAAMRGSVPLVSALLRKSEANEEENEKNIDARRAARRTAKRGTSEDVTMEDAGQGWGARANADDESDVEMVESAEINGDEGRDTTTEQSMVKINPPAREKDDQALVNEDNNDEPDIYDVNVVAWDTAVSPLHLAIVNGHVDVVKCLVQDFGADVLLPIKLFNDHDKSARAAILTLVLALQLPLEKAESMTKTLIELGSSSAQGDVNQTTALQYCVADRPHLLDTLADADATGVTRAINHLSISGYRWSVQLSSPLMTAIQAKDSLTALRLLDLGAKPEIGFSAYMKAYQSRYDPPRDSKQNKRNYQQSLDQPVISAVNCELPLTAKRLVEDGADPNVLTKDGYKVLSDEYSRRHMTGRSLLDQVRKKLESLKTWKPKTSEPEAPEQLGEDSEYLSGFKEGSYAFWSAECQLHHAKIKYMDDSERYQKHLAERRDETGVAEKQEAVNRMVDDFEQLEKALIERGAKTFKELHPNVEEPEKRDQHSYRHHQNEPKPFKVELNFQIGDLTEQSQRRYEKLFEAAWNGEVKVVKELTLNPWKDENDEDQPPCKVALQDQHSLSPFSIAVLRGHYELATVIMDIAQAQHVSADPPKKQRYEMDAGDSEDGSDSDTDVQLYSEIVDDEFTVDNIGEVSMKVKSRVLPVDMMQWTCPPAKEFAKPNSPSGLTERPSDSGFSYFGPRRIPTRIGKRTNTGSLKLPNPSASRDMPRKEIPAPTNLFQQAIYNNNPELLGLLLDLGKDYSRLQPGRDHEASKEIFKIPNKDFDYALKVGHSHLIAEIIKNTGAGIPLDSLAKKYGADLKEKPKYYQGLSVHGMKRKDWADAGRDNVGHESAANHTPPLLESAHWGSLEAVEWLLSDSPLRCYREHALANQDDKRVQKLSQSNAGYDGTVEKFLSIRSHLAIHCCLIGPSTAESDALLRYLIEVLPDTLEARSMEGLTPLLVAFELYREDAAKLLIQAAVDQTCRDKSGRNILHSLLSHSFEHDSQVGKLKRMLNLIDKRVLPSLFTERSSGSLTPMHYWLKNTHPQEPNSKVMKLLLEYGGGQELSLISGEGDTPLHHTVKRGDVSLSRVILEHDAALLNRENATGRTPYEMAEDDALADVCRDPPPMPKDHSFGQRRAKRCGLPLHWNIDVLNCSPKSFTAEESKPVELGGKEKVWKMLQDTKARLDAEGQWKRRLVTLNEASEVARRLAAMKSGETGNHDNDERELVEGEEEHVRDEVQAWLESAKRDLENTFRNSTQ